MIPQRIRLQGFLCYRDPQEIAFDDSPLWMLSGLNGSGKSAVFDAVTFALFGGHRGGLRNAEELVNKESDGLLVEVDFRQGDDAYRIKRTLKKVTGRPTRQVYRYQPAVGSDPIHGVEGVGPAKAGHYERDKGTWLPVENTTNQRGFDQWVADNLGLNYETFTSSVLLMQGRAEKLLNADAGDRRKVLAGIVDLERYERLHRKADDLRKRFKDKAEDLQQKVNVLAEVSDEELAAAEQQITDSQAELDRARAEVERRQWLQGKGERWAELQKKLAEVSTQWERAQGLLERAEGIERDWGRLRLLRAVLPPLRTCWEQRERLVASRLAAAALAVERDGLAGDLQQVDYAQEQTRGKQEQLQQLIADDQQREQEVGRRLVELSGVLARVELCEKQRRAVALVEADLGKLPPDPVGVLAQEQETCDRLAVLAQAVPFLVRMREEREGLRTAGAQARTAGEEERAITAQGTQLALDVRKVGQQLEAATKTRARAADRASETRTLLTEAKKHLEELTDLKGAKVCRHCGQALTAEHLEEETARRTQARADAEAAYREAEQASKAAVAEEKRLQDQFKEMDARIAELREQHRVLKTRRQHAEGEVQRHGRECGRAWQELAEPFRLRVAAAPPEDWLATEYPGAADMDEACREARGLDEARRRLRQAQDVVGQWNRLQAKRDEARQALAAQEADLPADVPALRGEHATLQAEDGAVKQRLRERRAQLAEEQATLDRLGRQRQTVQQRLADREQRLGMEQVRQEACAEALGRARGALPDDWQAEADGATSERLRQLQEEQATLERQGVEAGAQELQQARERLEFLRQEKAARARDLEEVPEEARREPAELKRLLGAARQDQKTRETDLDAARSARKALADRREQRRLVQEELLAADQKHHRYELLAKLLGPKRLQLHLVRQAERGIVDFANEVLDRLSGGQLYLRLRGEEGDEAADKALDLEAYNRTAGDAAIGVSFLSGSQRFRVAVSLALGMGRYASRQHRPIESVIIDEGFGCLDRNGRQVMIQELQNLRGQMRCILLVSHQEEFAEAFANGYRFELSNGTTEVTRLQR